MSFVFDKEINVFRCMQGYGDSLVADIVPVDFCKQPIPGMNHPAWILGHLAVSSDRHGTFVGGEQRLLDWKPRFGFASELSTNLEDYPSKDELIAAWHDANERFIAAVAAAKPADLAKPNEYHRPECLPTVGDFLAFSMTAHASTHLGQLSAWRRADGRAPLF